MTADSFLIPPNSHLMALPLWHNLGVTHRPTATLSCSALAFCQHVVICVSVHLECAPAFLQLTPSSTSAPSIKTEDVRDDMHSVPF